MFCHIYQCCSVGRWCSFNTFSLFGIEINLNLTSRLIKAENTALFQICCSKIFIIKWNTSLLRWNKEENGVKTNKSSRELWVMWYGIVPHIFVKVIMRYMLDKQEMLLMTYHHLIYLQTVYKWFGGMYVKN